VLIGPKDAELTIICWGSTAGPVLDSIKELEKMGLSVNLIRPIVLHPFPTDFFTKALKDATTTIAIEGNSEGQLAGLIRERTGVSIDFEILKYDGRPFTPDEIIEKVTEALK
jgi:2-oxoglutarate/2-oxoacid ferredoxin oxidoreductase subunit alpha